MRKWLPGIVLFVLAGCAPAEPPKSASNADTLGTIEVFPPDTTEVIR